MECRLHHALIGKAAHHFAQRRHTPVLLPQQPDVQFPFQLRAQSLRRFRELRQADERVEIKLVKPRVFQYERVQVGDGRQLQRVAHDVELALRVTLPPFEQCEQHIVERYHRSLVNEDGIPSQVVQVVLFF